MFYACHLPRSASNSTRGGFRPLRAAGPVRRTQHAPKEPRRRGGATTPFVKRPPLLS
ncbi:hypothetical protein SF83666_c11210 [Sinorhizobium fredii CCBAU 83666]|nr:hypothetical protein SF83666_c11210 [Sinorhizobium fredii CCBAU 83666]